MDQENVPDGEEDQAVGGGPPTNSRTPRIRKMTERGLQYTLDVRRCRRKDTWKLLLTDKLSCHLHSMDVPVGIIRQEYSVWLVTYEEFLVFNEEYQSLLSSEELAVDNKGFFMKHDSNLEQCKHRVQEWLLENDKPPSVNAPSRRSKSLNRLPQNQGVRKSVFPKWRKLPKRLSCYPILQLRIRNELWSRKK
jgi:hypothetical protein